MTDLATVGPFTVKAYCEQLGPVTGMSLFVNGPTGTYDLMQHAATNDAGYVHSSTQSGYAASTDEGITSVGAGEGNRGRMAGTAMIKAGSDVVQVDFNGVAHNPSGSGGDNCYLYGTATMGT